MKKGSCKHKLFETSTVSLMKTNSLSSFSTKGSPLNRGSNTDASKKKLKYYLLPSQNGQQCCAIKSFNKFNNEDLIINNSKIVVNLQYFCH